MIKKNDQNFWWARWEITKHSNHIHWFRHKGRWVLKKQGQISHYLHVYVALFLNVIVEYILKKSFSVTSDLLVHTMQELEVLGKQIFLCIDQSQYFLHKLQGQGGKQPCWSHCNVLCIDTPVVCFPSFHDKKHFMASL